jgi:hypothetical protein
MPRTARLEAPGVLHDVMIQGIECRKILRDDQDRVKLLEGWTSFWGRLRHTATPGTCLLYRQCLPFFWPRTKPALPRAPFYAFFFALATHFPDNTLWPELAIGAWVGTGLTLIKAFLAVTGLHLLAGDISGTIRMISALHSGSQ